MHLINPVKSYIKYRLINFYSKVLLCVKCLSPLNCDIPSFCSSKVEVEKISIKSAMDDNENDERVKDTNECQFVIPEILKVEIPQGNRIRSL